MVKEYKYFRCDSVADALEDCETEGYKASFMPQIIDERISADKTAVVWKNWYSSVSVRVTGRTQQGSKVVVFGHVPNYFSKSGNIKKAVEQGLVNGAGRMPQKEFQKLVDKDGLVDRTGHQAVFVVDYDVFTKSPSAVIPVGSALEHPMVVPFLGGEKRAVDYLKRHVEVYGSNIGVGHCDDFSEDSALGRFLVVGYGDYLDLSGVSSLSYFGSFRGWRVAKKNPDETKVKVCPSLVEILRDSRPFVSKASWDEFKEVISKRYKQ